MWISPLEKDKNPIKYGFLLCTEKWFIHQMNKDVPKVGTNVRPS